MKSARGGAGRAGGEGGGRRRQTGLPGGHARGSDHPAKSHTLLAPYPPRLQLRLGFNLHNLPHLEGLGGGENRRVQRTGEGFSKHQRKPEGEKLGQEKSRLQTTDNILPSRKTSM